MADEQEKSLTINDLFNVLYKSSLLGGIVLSILFFTFYGNALPSIGNISQLSNYLIAVFGVALFFISYFSLTILAPSLLTIDKDFTGNKNHLMIHFLLISVVISACLMTKSLPILLFLFIIFAIQWIQNICWNGKWKTILSFYGGLSLFTYAILNILFSSIFISALSKNSTAPDIQLSIIALQVMFFGTNLLIIQNRELFQNLKSNFKKIMMIFFLAIIVVLTAITLAFSFVKKQNLIITAPFNILKLGYYPAELHFKKEFIETSNPFPQNETNQTSNIFFVLSSVGDEYIFCDKNASNGHNSSRTYRIKKENVEYEIVGNEFNDKNTTWNHDAQH